MALSLSKTGIAQSNTINAWHVTQSVDALTGTYAYDLTVSGSLTLTGSVKSQDGYTGSLFGTASWADNVITASYALTASQATTASFAVDYTDPVFLDGTIYPSGSPSTPFAPQKLISGAGQTDGLNAAAINITELTGKVLNQDCFIVATCESAAGDAISVQNLAGSTINFVSQNPNTKFNFIVTYV